MRKMAILMMLAVAIFVVSSNAFAYWQSRGPLQAEIKDPMPNPYGPDWVAIK